MDLNLDDFVFIRGDVLTLEIQRRGELADDRVANILSAFDPLLQLPQSRWGKFGFVGVYRGDDASQITRDFLRINFHGYDTGIPYEPLVGEGVILAPVGSGWLRISGEAAEMIIEGCGDSLDGRDIYYDTEPPEGDYVRIELGEGFIYFVGDPGRVLLDQLWA